MPAEVNTNNSPVSEIALATPLYVIPCWTKVTVLFKTKDFSRYTLR